MKEFFLRFKKTTRFVFVLFTILLVFTILRIIFGISIAGSSPVNSNQVTNKGNMEISGWNNEETRKMQKEIHWLEQLLILAKSDSINLGINLADSIVQVQLKGTVLFQSKILELKPAGFLENMNEEAYLNFSKISSMTYEKANIPKKPIKRVVAPNSATTQTETKEDIIADRPLIWQFAADNNINVIITGVKLNSDSIPEVLSSNDLFKYRADEFFSSVFPEKYTPTLFLWLKDMEAKSIYRAFPEKGKVIFRN